MRRTLPVPRCGMRYRRMPIEVESPEQLGYSTIAHNLSESSVADRRLSDLGLEAATWTTCCSATATTSATRSSASRSPRLSGVRPDDVLVTPGAAHALFCTATSLLEKGDHAVVVRTNYATNLETPRAIGADLDVVDLRFEDGWALDVEEVRRRVRPGETRLLSVTAPHNPTGTSLTEDDLHALVGIAESQRRRTAGGRDVRRPGARHPPAGRRVALAAGDQRGVDVEGLRTARPPGRLGRHDRPGAGRDAARRQGAVGDLRADASTSTSRAGCSAERDRLLPRDPGRRARRGRDVVAALAGRAGRLRVGAARRWRRSGWCASARRSRSTPSGSTAPCSPTHGTYVGPGHWFELDDRHFRLGYGWPTHAELEAGLAALTAAAGSA